MKDKKKRELRSQYFYKNPKQQVVTGIVNGKKIILVVARFKSESVTI